MKPELKDLRTATEVAVKAMSADKENLNEALIVIINDGKESSIAGAGTGRAMAIALYSCCKTDPDMANIVMSVASKLMENSMGAILGKKPEPTVVPMGPKGDA